MVYEKKRTPDRRLISLLLNVCFRSLCRYIEFRYPDGSPSKFYWHLVTLKLAFVILFEVRIDDFIANFKLISTRPPFWKA